MNARRIRTIILLAILPLIVCLAGNPADSKMRGINKTTQTGPYAPFVTNNLFNYYSNTGDGSWNVFTADGAFEFPRGTNKHLVFEDGIVWGGFHKGRTDPKVGGSVYRHALQPGRILTPGGPTETEVARAEDPYGAENIYRVRPDVTPGTPFSNVQTALEEEAALIGRYDPNVTAQTLYDAYLKDWNEWPGNGSTTDPYGLAPFDDVNGNGTYEPAIDIPGVPGARQTLYYVANDVNPYTQYLAGCPPIGLEVHRTFWGYDSAGAAGNAIFSSTVLINKSGAPVENMFVAQWADPDVGFAGDDLAGCDRQRNLAYAYNGASTDEVYGTAVPAVGYQLLQGPIVPSPGDSASFRMGYRHGYKNLGMNSCLVLIFGDSLPAWRDPAQGPRGDVEWYRALNGLSPSTGEQFVNPTNGQPTRFIADGDPVTGQGWVDGAGNMTPNDRRICLVTGPFTMANGDTQEVVVANVVGVGEDRISSVSVLKAYCDELQARYHGIIDKVEEQTQPQAFELSQNYPNPFNPTTTITYALPRRLYVSLTVFNVLGQKVADLINGEIEAGSHEVTFNAAGLASGVYFYRMQVRSSDPAAGGTGEFTQARKLCLVR